MAQAELSIIPYENGLTAKQQAFADHYILSRNGTESALKAGYDGGLDSLAVIASENLRKVNIQAYIAQRLRRLKMSSDEVLQRLSEQARSDIGELLNDDGSFDIAEARRKKLSHLVKKVRTKTVRRKAPGSDDEIEEVTHELELYNAQTALELVGKANGIFADRSAGDTTINIGTLELDVTLTDALAQVIDVTPEPQS
jgi:phage terminase small subunit